MSKLAFQNKSPQIHESVFLAEGAIVIGDVEIGSGSSVWFNTVVRGDVNYIRIGKNTNIQDLTMIHVASGKYPTFIGDDVTVGHRAIIHACTIGNRCLIGMGAVIMDGAVIEDDCIVAAGSLVTERTRVPAGTVIRGLPAKQSRPIEHEEKKWIECSARDYALLAQRYLLKSS